MEEEITINNVKYVTESKCLEVEDTLRKEINNLKDKLNEERLPNSKIKALRFNEKEYTKLINLMSKIFEIQTESVNEEWAVNNDFGVIDPANVCLIIGKTEEAKRLLSIFKPFESDTKIPNLDYSPEGETKEKGQKARFSHEYFNKIIQVLNVTDEALNITIKYDYPGLFENRHFKFILAPRVNDPTE